ncbi:MAG: hypothetical protein WCI92_18575 [Bacteroidota bacterium]
MKTAKFTSAIATFTLVLFMSLASIANTATFNTGDLTRSAEKSLAISVTYEKDFSYLRFDANKFMNENEEDYAIVSYLDYLRFDVNDFMRENESEITELPVANEFEYLRFDANRFSESNPDAMTELPVNEYDYLRFDATDFANSNNGTIDELPVTE